MNNNFFQKTVNWVFMFVLTLGLFLPASSTLALPQKVGPAAQSAQAIFPVDPDDTEYVAGTQWALNGTWGINMPLAWGMTTTTLDSATSVVAVLDTGITDHIDIDDVLPGYDFVSAANRDGDARDSDPHDPGDWGCGADSTWHGTHVAGIIGAASDNALGIAGIDWKANILPVRVSGNCGSTTAVDIVDGMRWAAGLSVAGVTDNNPLANQADVIHVSASLPGVSCTAYQADITAVLEAGSVIVAPAGDAGTTSIGFPANCDGVITVSATDIFGKRASFSNYGDSATVVEISAPGGGNNQGDVLSTINSGNENSVTDGGIYSTMKGTSIAAAHVSGVVSLMFSVNPYITPDKVLKILQNTARGFNAPVVGEVNPCTTSNCGSGIVDASEAVRVANMPDLVITNVTVNETLLEPYSAEVSISVQNQGGFNLHELNSNSIVYRSVYVDLDPADMTDPDSGPGCLVTDMGEPSYFFTPNFNSTIPANATITEEVTISGLPDGPHLLNAYVDAECNVDESFEDNHYVPPSGTPPVSIYVGTPSDAPILVSPANASFSTVKTPKLTVLAATDPDLLNYTFELYSDPARTTKLVDVTPATPITSYALTAAQALPYGTYYWQARSNLDGTPAGDGIADDQSDWSVPNKFGVTFQTAPISNAYLLSARPIFTWLAVTGALGYQLQVSKTEDFTDLKINLNLGKVIKYVPPANMDYGTYYWRMRACTLGGCTTPLPPSVAPTFLTDEFEFGSKFTLTPPLSAIPVLVSPATKAVVATKTPTLTWKKVLEDDRYQVQIDNLSTFVSPERDYVTLTGIVNYTATTSPAALPDGMYYWRVRTSNYLTAPGAWSVSRSFRIDTTGPLAPVLSAPASSSTVLLIGTPLFKWIASLTATRYQFQYDNDVDFLSPTYTSAELTMLYHTPPAITPGTYYWHVRAKDAYGNWGPYSAYRMVTITLPKPLAPVLIAPADKSVTKDQTPTFSWNAVGYGNEYQIDISTVNTFPADARTTTTIVPSVEGNLTYTHTPPSNLPSQIHYWRVSAINSASVSGPFSAPVRSITVDITPPLEPVLSEPLNNASAISTPTFKWVAYASAYKYRLELATDSGFTTGLYTSAELASNILTYKPPVVMTPGTTYYWRVRARDAAGNWSLPATSRKLTILLAPTLTATAAVISDSTPSLSWSLVLGTGITYEIQISKTSAFTLPVAQTASGLSGTTHPVTPFLPDGLYYWRVRAASTAPAVGAWSTVKSFTVDTLAPATAPVLSAPADNASVLVTPSFSWTAVATATKYIFAYDNDANLLTPTYISAQLAVTKITPPAMPAGTYYWHVKAVDAAGNEGAWSTLSRKVTILPAPILTATAAVISDSTPDLSWSPVLGTGITYEIQISKTSAFTLPVVQTASGWSGTTYPVPTVLPDGLYYWRVRAASPESALPGPWSLVKSFTVDTLAPLAPVLSSPLDNVSVIATPLFSWGASVGAFRYTFEYDVDSGFGSAVGPSSHYTSVPLTVTKITPSPAMPAGTYYWHVKAVDAAGNESAWSTPRKVTILPAPVLIAPLNKSFINDPTPDLSWIAVSGTGIITYEIQISKTATFTLPVAQTASSLSGTTYPVDPLLPAGLYYWRVRAAITPAVGVWSAAWTFTVDTTPPAAPALSAPAAGVSVIGTPSFSWLAASTATKYVFEYADDSGFTTTVVTFPEQTTLKITPPAMMPSTYYWRVKAKDAAGNWSPYSLVRILNILPTPPAPVLLLPATAYLTSNPTPTFTWNAVTGTGITYDIQISKTSTFVIPVAQTTTGLTELTYPATALTDGLYYWRVRAVSGVLSGAWSAYRTFTVDTTAPTPPTLSLPAAGTPPTIVTTVNGSPTFTWLKSTTGATKYQFEYDVDPDFGNTGVPPLYPLHFTSAEFTAATSPLFKPATMSLGTYHWRVRARDAAGNLSGWSVTRVVKVVPAVPKGVPVLVGPVNGKIITDTDPLTLTPPVTASWNMVTGAVTYYIEIDKNSTFSSPDFSDTTSLLNITVTTLDPGTYYWRVRHNDKYGGAGIWSALRRFSIDVVAPLAIPQAIE